MKRFNPNKLLTLLERWLSSCYSCVKWDNAWSEPFRLSFGVRQGSVLSPYLFVWFNGMSVFGVFVQFCMLMTFCWQPFSLWSLHFNEDLRASALQAWYGTEKSCCLALRIRKGPRNNASCLCVAISWYSHLIGDWDEKISRYIYCALTHIEMLSRTYQKVICKGRSCSLRTSEEVTLQLIKSKCLPVLRV